MRYRGNGQAARQSSEGEKTAVLICQEVGVATGLRKDGARNYRTASSPSQTCPNLGVLFAGWCFSCLSFTFKLSYSHLDLGWGVPHCTDWCECHHGRTQSCLSSLWDVWSPHLLDTRAGPDSVSRQRDGDREDPRDPGKIRGPGPSVSVLGGCGPPGNLALQPWRWEGLHWREV